MKSKERVIAALNHRQPDKIPVDFGGTPVTGIHVKIIEELRKHYGLDQHPVKVTEPYQMLGEIEDDLARVLGVDISGLSPKNNMFGFANENWQEFEMPWGQKVLVPGDFNVTKENGDLLMYPEGDTSAEPSAKMPESGYFFDAIIRQEPIDEDKLDPKDNTEEFSPITNEDLQYWKQEIDKYAGKEQALIANFGGTAFGDIALVPAMQLKKPKGIRDISEWYMSTMMRPDYIHTVFEKQSEIAIENLQKIFAIVGNRVEAVFICGTDFGTQDSQFCAPETFRELYMPYYQKINNWIHENTDWKTFKHSCGAVEPFMPLFIESGFDIINPVQINASGMDPEHLKKEYGDKLVFWGGGIDTQKILPFGSKDEIRQQVYKQCEILSKNGGFVFNTVHNIQANVPVENVIIMVDAIKEFNGEK